jgi:hypothetical protein
VLVQDSEGTRGWPEEMVVELRVAGRRRSDSDTHGGGDVVATSEGPEIAVGEEVAGDQGVLRGSLIEEHHGGVPDDLRPIEGVVRGLKVVSQRFRLADRTLTPIPGTVRFREVERMPDRFVSPSGDTSPEQWREIGALAEIELD